MTVQTMSDEEDSNLEDVLASDAENREGEEAAGGKPRKRLMRMDEADAPDDDDDEDEEEGKGPKRAKVERGVPAGNANEEKDELIKELEDNESDEHASAAADDDGFIVQDEGFREDPDDVIRTEGGWGNDSDIEEREGEGDQSALQSTFLRTMADAKLAKKKRKSKTPQEVEEELTDLVTAMMAACDKDRIMLENGKPAIYKMKLLPKVEQAFKKVECRDQFLDMNALQILKTWMDLLPNEDFPLQPLRTRLLTILDQLPVDAEWPSRMEESQGLPKLLTVYSKKEPHPPNGRLARSIVNRWSRTLATGDNQVDDPEEQQRKREEMERRRRERIMRLSETQRAAEEFEKKRNLKKTERIAESYARPPERLSLGNFAKRPEPGMGSASVSSKVAESEHALSTDKLKSLEKAAKKIKATGQAGLTRAHNVSVQGQCAYSRICVPKVALFPVKLGTFDVVPPKRCLHMWLT
ncbi:Protein IWS1-like 2 [Porphyridium purpureum]|uniref:Protein IWS1-like 2 n=1 Tax=Porphyridium purpureum TaxID=35688 RepID=A0A5J4YUQ3_PORPP|nr:Protein IWS1-like 2 [Porphyridium purpureum]|eukprot:POR8108..scf227_4